MLDLIWSAHFADKMVIRQYDDTEKEHLFKEVQEKQNTSKLVRFILWNPIRDTKYQVCLETGMISIYSPDTDSDTRPEVEVSGNSKYEYRLIYFRRVTRHLTWAGKQITDKGVQDIQYFLGLQYTNEKNENVKRLLQISKHDEVYFA